MIPQEIALQIAVLEERLQIAQRFVAATLQSLAHLREQVMTLPKPMKKTKELHSGPNVAYPADYDAEGGESWACPSPDACTWDGDLCVACGRSR